MNRVELRDLQRTRKLSLGQIRRITNYCLKHLLSLDGAEIGIEFVTAERMAEINFAYLKHTGSTDVITFSYADAQASIHGDIVICVADAIAQAKEFETSWHQEVIRYIVHGLLHLLGEDDLTTPARVRMKRRENLLVGELAGKFDLRQIGAA